MTGGIYLKNEISNLKNYGKGDDGGGEVLCTKMQPRNLVVHLNGILKRCELQESHLRINILTKNLPKAVTGLYIEQNGRGKLNSTGRGQGRKIFSSRNLHQISKNCPQNSPNFQVTFFIKNSFKISNFPKTFSGFFKVFPKVLLIFIKISKKFFLISYNFSLNLSIFFQILNISSKFYKSRVEQHFDFSFNNF